MQSLKVHFYNVKWSNSNGTKFMGFIEALQMQYLPNYDEVIVNIAIAKYLSNVKNAKGDDRVVIHQKNSSSRGQSKTRSSKRFL